MGGYAEGTSVPIEQSQMEISALLRRFGATSLSVGYKDNRSFIIFRVKDRYVRLTLAAPSQQDRRFAVDGRGRPRDAAGRQKARDQEYMRLWRCMVLLVKSKLTAIDEGIVDFETEFLPHIMLPNGETVGQHVRPALSTAYETGEMPRLLPGGAE